MDFRRVFEVLISCTDTFKKYPTLGQVPFSLYEPYATHYHPNFQAQLQAGNQLNLLNL